MSDVLSSCSAASYSYAEAELSLTAIAFAFMALKAFYYVSYYPNKFG